MVNRRDSVTKIHIQQKVKEIYEKGVQELDDFALTVSLSDVDDKARTILSRAIEDRRLFLNLQSPIVETSELRVGEI